MLACTPGTDTAITTTDDCGFTVPSTATPLRAEGPHLYDASNRRVILRGINTGGRSKFAPYAPFDFEDGTYQQSLDAYLDRLVHWGLTTLRVPFSWAAAEPAQGAWDEDFLTRYDALLDGAADRDLWTIVDFHQDIYGEWFCGDGFPSWTVETAGDPCHDDEDWFFNYMTQGDVSLAFDDLWDDTRGARTAMGTMWDTMAARHADRPGVIGFEIINEPIWGTQDPAVWGAETMPVFYAEMADRIQAQAPDALVFFDGTGVDSVTNSTSITRPEGDNLVFAPHSYDPSMFMGGELGDNRYEAFSAWSDQGIEWDLPVTIGEFGIEPHLTGAGEHTASIYAALDSLQLHATWWEYSASTELWNHEDLSVVEADGTERDVLLDPIVRAYPRAIAESDPTRTSWSVTDDVLKMTWSPTPDGVTEIILPPRVFDGGATATGADCHRIDSDRLWVHAHDDAEISVSVTPG